ncbi:VOC family protein [Cohnella sp.]|uniref:VOC family protein n=1 Tax=Cohnella sp. TaxID=1883426 RepID=UPI0035695D1C
MHNQNDQPFERIDGVFLPVKILNESINWYENTLGLKLLYKWPGGAGFQVSEGESLLGLIEVDDFKPALFKSKEGIMHYFNFKSKDVAKSREMLITRGVETTGSSMLRQLLPFPLK